MSHCSKPLAIDMRANDVDQSPVPAGSKLATEIARIYALSVLIKTDVQFQRACTLLRQRLDALAQQLENDAAAASGTLRPR